MCIVVFAIRKRRIEKCTSKLLRNATFWRRNKLNDHRIEREHFNVNTHTHYALPFVLASSAAAAAFVASCTTTVLGSSTGWMTSRLPRVWGCVTGGSGGGSKSGQKPGGGCGGGGMPWRKWCCCCCCLASSASFCKTEHTLKDNKIKSQRKHCSCIFDP